MRFFIVDDDEGVRTMLAEFIEDNDLGQVIGEAENGSEINAELLAMKAIDILIIDLLMPKRDGIETVREIKECFTGGIVMLSQVEDKEMIGNAYLEGINYYITKPINQIEVLSVLRNLIEHLHLQKVIANIEKNLTVLSPLKTHSKGVVSGKKSILMAGQYLLTEIGMIGETGSKDLLDILEYLIQYEEGQAGEYEFPSLRDIFVKVVMKRLGKNDPDSIEVKKETKALEQRVRRAIFQGLNHLASLGVTDYSNPKFEEYAPIFFEFSEVRKLMRNLEENDKPAISDSRINIKRFVKILLIEAKKRQ